MSGTQLVIPRERGPRQGSRRGFWRTGRVRPESKLNATKSTLGAFTVPFQGTPHKKEKRRYAHWNPNTTGFWRKRIFLFGPCPSGSMWASSWVDTVRSQDQYALLQHLLDPSVLQELAQDRGIPRPTLGIGTGCHGYISIASDISSLRFITF